eukprot:3018335-Prymnesium_polylepis.1
MQNNVSRSCVPRAYIRAMGATGSARVLLRAETDAPTHPLPTTEERESLFSLVGVLGGWLTYQHRATPLSPPGGAGAGLGGPLPA